MNAPKDLPADPLRFGSGHTVRRIEDPTLVTGRGQYTDDLQREGLAHLVFVRSPHAHARLVAVDTTAALGIPGVLAVYTGADLEAAGVKPLGGPPPNFKRPDGSPAATAPRRGLALGTVRYVGETVAAVVALSRETAVDAAEAVAVEYEELPAVAAMEDALAPGAPALCDRAPDNVCAVGRTGDAAACAAAFARAAHVVRLDLVNQRLAPSPIEPRVVMAEPEPGTGRLLVTLSNQMPTGIRDSLDSLLPGLT